MVVASGPTQITIWKTLSVNPIANGYPSGSGVYVCVGGGGGRWGGGGEKEVKGSDRGYGLQML